MKAYNRLLILFLLAILSTNLLAAGIPDIESTRIKSMAGTGVGSLLLNEASILNPASVVFFDKSSFYFQNDKGSLTDRSNNRTGDLKDSVESIVGIIDISSPLKGGVNYIYQNTTSGKRIRYSASMATNVGGKSALGIIYRYTKEESDILDENYHQLVIGGTSIVHKSTSIGFTVVDPTQNNSEYFKYTVGAHFTVNDFISLIVDVGSGDVKNRETESFTKWSVQLQSFESFYLRYGRFHDKLQNQKGTAVGFSWVGPRFSIDYGLKIAENISTELLLDGEKFEETSVAIAVLF